MKHIAIFLLLFYGANVFSQGIKYSQLDPNVEATICANCPDEVNDADTSVMNEIQSLDLLGGVLSISSSNNVTLYTENTDSTITLDGICLPTCDITDNLAFRLDTIIKPVDSIVLREPYLNIQRTVITGTTNVYGFQVDTLETRYTIVDAHGNLATTLEYSWQEQTCTEQNQTCVTETTETFFTFEPNCTVLSTGGQLSYAFPYTLTNATGLCDIENDSNNSITFAGGGATVTGSAVLVGSIITINAGDWSVTFDQNTVATIATGGLIDFEVSAAGPIVTEKTDCGSLCQPATTAVFADDINTVTGEFNLLQEMVINGSTVPTGECYRLSVLDASTQPPALLQTFESLVGNDVTTLTNYSPLIFPVPTNTLEHNQSITINKIELAISLGLAGVNAIEMTFKIEVGGTWCSPPTQVLLANISVINEVDQVCHIKKYAFDNQNIDPNITFNDVDGVRFWDIFQAEPPYPAIGGVIEATISCLNNNPSFCNELDIPNNNLGVAWTVTELQVGSQLLPFNQPIPELGGTPMNQIHASELASALTDADIFENLQFVFRSDILTQGVGRCFSYIETAYCSSKDLRFIRVESDDGLCYAIYQVERFPLGDF